MLYFGGLLHSGFNYGTEHKIQYILRYAPGKKQSLCIHCRFKIGAIASELFTITNLVLT